MTGATVKKSMSSNQIGSSSAKGKIITSNLKKKIETSSKQQSIDSKNRSISQKFVKSEDKGKGISSKTPVKKVVKREKKVYSLPGQKHDPPEEREPLRIFYETLSKQIPSSEMAEFWMMEHGLLSPEKAKKAYEKKQRKQKQLRTGIPMKSPPSRAPPPRPPPPRATPSRPESSNKPKIALKNESSNKPKIATKNESSNKPKIATKNGDAKPKRKFIDDDDDDYEVIRSPKIRKT